MLKHSQSMPRALDGNNSVSSNFSIRTNMLTSLNAKDKIPEHYIQKVTSEADILMESAEQFKKIWEDIKKLSTIQKGILSSTNFATLFKKYHHIITPIFHLTEAKDLFDILDEDNVGPIQAGWLHQRGRAGAPLQSLQVQDAAVLSEAATDLRLQAVSRTDGLRAKPRAGNQRLPGHPAHQHLRRRDPQVPRSRTRETRRLPRPLHPRVRGLHRQEN